MHRHFSKVLLEGTLVNRKYHWLARKGDALTDRAPSGSLRPGRYLPVFTLE